MRSDDNLSFLRYCIDEQYPFPLEIERINWDGLYAFATQQAISAIIVSGIERLGNNKLNIPRHLLFNWIGDLEQIKQQNRFVNQRCVEIVELLRKDGFECCVLKGQGNAAMYPHPYDRTPGDIDVWVKPPQELEGDDNGFIRKVIAYAKTKNPGGIANNIHVDYGDFGGVEVEIHFKPTFFYNPFYNKRLKSWIKEQKNVFGNKCILPDGKELCVPTVEFNIVYQLIHMYKHVISEGLGLRQIIDYYYLLKSNGKTNMVGIASTLRNLGLLKFGGAIMYLLHNVLGLEEKHLIVPVDRRRGNFLLEEILRGGNFGKYDTTGYFIKWNNPIGNWLRHLEHDIRLVRYFPSECLWEPVARIYQYFWRKRYNKNK